MIPKTFCMVNVHYKSNFFSQISLTLIIKKNFFELISDMLIWANLGGAERLKSWFITFKKFFGPNHED